jgi:hypothetical protein
METQKTEYSMPTAFQDLCAAAKTKPKAGEDFEAFAKRLTSKVNALPDAAWQSLGDGSAAQTWHNEAMTVITDTRKAAKAEARKNGEDEDAAAAAIALPELEGYEPMAEAEDEPKQEDLPLPEPEGEEEVNPDTGEVTEAKAKPKKAGKEKKAKPAKVEKVAKEKVAKPAKAEKPAKVAKEKKAKPVKKEGEARGRRSLFEDTDKVKVLVKPNPHREGSTRWKAYMKLKDGATVAENVRLGVPRQQIWSLVNREIVKVG